MFYGEYEHSIDRKGRLILPAKFREVARTHFIERFFVTRGLDKCLFMFSEEEWRTQENKFKAMPFTQQQARTFNRLYFSGAVDVIADKQGRILVPQYLKDFAGIKKDVVIVGVSNRVEIWSKDTWYEFYGNSQASFEEIAEKLMGNI
jgi:MraZ protein